MDLKTLFSPGITARQGGACETVAVEEASACDGVACPPDRPHCIVENGQARCVECVDDSHCQGVCRNNSCQAPGGGGVDPRMLAAGAVVVGGAYWYSQQE